jgi:hypothetical protein
MDQHPPHIDIDIDTDISIDTDVDIDIDLDSITSNYYTYTAYNGSVSSQHYYNTSRNYQNNENMSRNHENNDDDYERTMRDSAAQAQARAQQREEEEYRRALAASKAEAPPGFFRSPEEEEAEVRRIMEQSAKDFYDAQKAEFAVADDDHAALSAIREKSMEDWHHETWNQKAAPDNWQERCSAGFETTGQGPASHQQGFFSRNEGSTFRSEQSPHYQAASSYQTANIQQSMQSIHLGEPTGRMTTTAATTRRSGPTMGGFGTSYPTVTTSTRRARPLPVTTTRRSVVSGLPSPVSPAPSDFSITPSESHSQAGSKTTMRTSSNATFRAPIITTTITQSKATSNAPSHASSRTTTKAPGDASSHPTSRTTSRAPFHPTSKTPSIAPTQAPTQATTTRTVNFESQRTNAPMMTGALPLPTPPPSHASTSRMSTSHMSTSRMTASTASPANQRTTRTTSTRRTAPSQHAESQRMAELRPQPQTAYATSLASDRAKTVRSKPAEEAAATAKRAAEDAEKTKVKAAADATATIKKAAEDAQKTKSRTVNNVGKDGNDNDEKEPDNPEFVKTKRQNFLDRLDQ